MLPSVVAVAALDDDDGGSSREGGGASGVAEAPPEPSTSRNTNSVECLGTGVEATCLVVEDGEGEGGERGDERDEKPSTSSSSSSSSASPLASLLSTLLLISPFFFWGSSMAAMKLLEPHTTPLFVAAVRLLPAGAILVAWAASKKRPVPSGVAAWVPIAVFALVDGAMFQGFLAEGLRRTTAGLGSVIIDSQPLTVAALSALLYGETLTLVGILGLGVGLAGLCLLEVPPEKIVESVPMLGSLLGSGGAVAGAGAGAGAGGVVEAATAAAAAAAVTATTTSSNLPSSIWDSGEFWMLLAAQSMAAGTLLVPWVSKRADPVMATGFHMLLGGLPLLALALAGEEGALLSSKISGITPSDLALLAYVSVLGSAASYGVFFYNASAGNLTRLSSLTFLTPGFAVATGYVFLGETLTPLQLVGAGVTLAAVALISTKGKNQEKEKEKAA